MSFVFAHCKNKWKDKRVNKKDFHKSKQSINLDLINVDQVVVFTKLKHSDGELKYFIVYKGKRLLSNLGIKIPLSVIPLLNVFS